VPKKKISDECLSDCVEAGLTQSKIAKICDISRQAVHQRVHRKLEKHHKKLQKYCTISYLAYKGYTVYEMSKELNTQHSSIHAVIKRYNIRVAKAMCRKECHIKIYG